MDKPSAVERFRYWFDGIMSKGLIALIGLLALASLALAFVVTVVVVVFGLLPAGVEREEYGFGEALWNTIMRTIDSGTMGGDQGAGFRAAMLVVTLGGVILVASLISVISSAFDTRVAELRKGRSRVLEHDHTLILGWSTKVFPIINELCIANESLKRAAVVILAEGDKVEMEDELRAKVPDPGRTKLIVRSGDPMDLTDLEMVNPRAARSIIVLAPEDVADPDSVVIKTALALTNNPRRGDEKLHIVGEIQNPANLEAAHLVGKDEAVWLLTDDLISRITVQTSRQSGLSVVYTELLDFDGDEIYFSEQPALVGRTYFEAQLHFEESTAMGLVANGTVLINPPADTRIGPGDEVILIAEDDSTVRLGALPTHIDTSAITAYPDSARSPEQALVLGCNSGLRTMLTELDEYVAPGSNVAVVADVRAPDLGEYTNLTIHHRRGDTTSRAVLDGLGVQYFNHIIVLADKERLEPQQADARTLITLLHLRDMADGLGVNLSVVSEMLDDRNRQLAEVTKADDFIVSDKLISLMLSQISENAQLSEVFDTLFSAEGSEIYLRPAELYVRPGADVNFYTLLEAARRRGETAIGYRIARHARSSEHAYGITVNPRKVDRVRFVHGDKLIVLAED